MVMNIHPFGRLRPHVASVAALAAVALLSVSCSTPPTPAPTGAAPVAAGKPRVIVLGSGDEITINVWRNVDMARTLMIDPAGNISMPLVGEVAAAGMTVSQLRDALTQRLAKYIKDPQVDINVTVLRSQRIHVLGEVKTPGTFTLEQTIYAWEAIPRAGGTTDDADEKNVLLVRKEGGKANITILDIRKAFEKGTFDDSLCLQSGDIVYVPPTTISDIEEFMIRVNNILNPIVNLEKGIVLGPDVADVLSGKSGSSDSTEIRVIP